MVGVKVEIKVGEGDAGGREVRRAEGVSGMISAATVFVGTACVG